MPRTPIETRGTEDRSLSAVGGHVRPAPVRAGLSGSKAILMPVAIVVVIGAIFISVYLAAFHAPVPRDLPVAVVGTAADAERMETLLEDRAPGAFLVRALPDEGAARAAVEHGKVFAAYASRAADGPLVLYAGAHGPSVTGFVTEAFAQAAADGERLKSLDVVPASPRDTRGLVVFYTTFGLVLSGYLFGIMTYQLAPRIALRQRLASLAAFGVGGGVVVAAIVRVFDVLPAPFLGVVGLVALVALAVGAATMTLVRTFGVVGSSSAAVLFMTLGNATSGGSLPADFLPGWLHPFSFVLPVGVGVRAVNGLAFFHGDGVARAVVVLSAWTLAGVIGLWFRERFLARRTEGH
ncbi:ABC transporter permease [Streptomyces sp. AK02-01A]|uniref:ABC transporter permease n=1 Tax=Streptomyces sp. AK02-01A TaxID=3028648 RepID=UPI0029AC3888|nr:ABC transporter permease [Streptomyces sp. AK02-01A]MDX3853460.1 ABC transporter permease [Streptomyces sp. AK02-01A]